MYCFIDRRWLFWKSNGWSWTLFWEVFQQFWKGGACTTESQQFHLVQTGSVTKYLLQMAFAKVCTLETLRTQWEYTDEDPNWSEQRLRCRRKSHSNFLKLLTAALSLTWSLSGLEGLSKAVCLLCCFRANQNWVHMHLSNANINQSVTDTATEPTPGCCPIEQRTIHRKNPQPHMIHLDISISSNSNSDQVCKIYDQSQVQFSARMAHSEICHSKQTSEIS